VDELLLKRQSRRASRDIDTEIRRQAEIVWAEIVAKLGRQMAREVVPRLMHNVLVLAACEDPDGRAG
jgi:tetrahydromethanopterin S-methyltransferase subunit G